MKIILDTNFVIAAVEYKLDIFSKLKEHQLYVITSVLKELEKLSKGTGKDAMNAKISVLLIDANGAREIRTEGPADNCLVELSKEAYVIATQDVFLKKRIKAVKGKTLMIRQRKKLEFS